MLNLDTHVLVHAFAGDLNSRERRILSAQSWSISAIVLWELEKLHQLGRILFDLEDPEIRREMARIQVWPIDIGVCLGLRELDFKSDPADEIIAATSLVHKVPLLTRDSRILKSKRVPLA